MRGFWLGPWLNEEAPDMQATLLEGMRLIAEGTIKLEAGAGLHHRHLTSSVIWRSGARCSAEV